MYHSVTFGSMNSFSDWHLVPDTRPVIAMPEPKITTVEVPGGNGVIDLSESLTGYPIYNIREGEMKFHVLNGHEDWHILYQRIANYLHGRRRKVILEDDPDYYYMGSHKVAWESKNDGTWSDVTISYQYEPYKYYKQNSSEEYSGVFSNLSSGTHTYYSSTNYFGYTPVMPEIQLKSVNGTVTVKLTNPELGISNLTKTFTASGTYKYSDFIFSNMSGTNNITVTISGTGLVSFTFRRASL